MVLGWSAKQSLLLLVDSGIGGWKPIALALAKLPHTALNLPISFFVRGDAVLAPLQPSATVLTAVGPLEDALAFALVIDIAATVLAPILPRKVSIPMLLIVLPLAIILAPVDPLVDAVTFHLVLNEVALKRAPIRPNETAMTVLLTVAIITLKDSTVSPNFLAEAMVFVIDPVSIVVRTVDMRVFAFAIRPVVRPVAEIDVAITVDNPPVPLLMVIHEVSIVAGAIRPYLRSTAMALAALAPFARVLDFRWEDDLLLALNDLAAHLDKLLAGRITPAEIADFHQLVLHHLATIVRGILTVLARVGRPKVQRWILDDIFDESLGEKAPRTCLQMHDLVDFIRFVKARRHASGPW